MPPKVNIIPPVMSNQERFQKWEEINLIICQIWNMIENKHKLCIIHNYNTDKEGHQKIDKEGKDKKCIK
ncbi:hypothetical protein MK805_02035 [Shimazuella sp. AN120528]|uniref:hypothetical protein n=1 Tax=Shimazuella soli TaxID=1892854 RepID=UPI001F0F5997|nr:hypothetical protein [Shimazuella soli]MCH5583747.1 hypothetical protein [Shimazuella soli]